MRPHPNTWLELMCPPNRRAFSARGQVDREEVSVPEVPPLGAGKSFRRCAERPFASWVPEGRPLVIVVAWVRLRAGALPTNLAGGRSDAFRPLASHHYLTGEGKLWAAIYTTRRDPRAIFRLLCNV